MDAREAQTLEQGDVILFQSQLYRVAIVSRSGHMVHLNGKLGDQIVPSTRMTLVWRKAEVPPDTQIGHLTTEEEAHIRAMVAARNEGKETDKETDHGKE